MIVLKGFGSAAIITQGYGYSTMILATISIVNIVNIGMNYSKFSNINLMV